MNVIPVIDLKNGQVVRGVAGQRDQYRRIQSQIVANAAAGPVARALGEVVRHQRFYVADLDAIAGAEPDWHAYEQIRAGGGAIMIDAGVNSVERAGALVAFADRQPERVSIVVALESSANPDELQQLVARIGSKRAVFSLDLREGRPFTGAAGWRHLSAQDIAKCAVQSGFERMIVLDLAAIGLDAGPRVLELCRHIRDRHSHVELTSGGGVRSVDDLRLFHRAGCDNVLVASALHNERITRSDLLDCDFLGSTSR